MAPQVYPKFLEAVGNGLINWPSDDFRVIIVDAQDYTYNAAHEFLSSMPAGARTAVSGTLANKTNVLGVLDADDQTIAGVTGDQSENLVIVRWDGGSDAARRLMCHLDSTSYTNLPVNPNGSGVTIQWPNDANKIMKL